MRCYANSVFRCLAEAPDPLPIRQPELNECGLSAESNKDMVPKIRFNWMVRTLVVLVVLIGMTAFMLPFSSAYADSMPLYSFNSSDGSYPGCTLTQGSDGDFYGTTEGGGTSNLGTVFKITSAGNLTTLHNFAFNDGAYPDAGLAQGSDGNFYGTAVNGGTDGGYGTVFRITSGGSFTILHSFNYSDGANPYGALVEGSDGNFYGTTFGGGGVNGPGTVFKITPNGSFTTIHNFLGSDGANPYAGLARASDGNFYGTTFSGGATDQGTVFRITPGGSLTTLHSFSGGDDSGGPYGGVVEASDGDFYGTTLWGGSSFCGTVFTMTLGGNLTTIHNFACTDGVEPVNSLVQATDGNLYGTTIGGGTHGAGEVFQIAPDGSLTEFYSFNGSDGASPWGALLQGSDGNLYGTTAGGGANDIGTIFKLTLNVGPPTDKEQCKDSGWMKFNLPRKFRNQGDCIQFINTGK
jgi:uncharacterized repeat protein (TIGR03803 family)